MNAVLGRARRGFVGRLRRRGGPVAFVLAVAVVAPMAVAVLPPRSLPGGVVIAPANAAPWAPTQQVLESDPPAPPSITPSGAESPYPRNNMLDADVTDVGAVANHRFTEAPSWVGTPPANYAFTAEPVSAGVAPTNNAFDDGLTGWTVSGTVTEQADAARGGWAKLGSGGVVTSAAFPVDPTAQAIVFDVGYLSASATDKATVYVLSGATFATSKTVGTASCASCGGWSTFVVDATAWRGQTIKVKVSRSSGSVGVDRLRPEVTLPGLETTGAVRRVVEGDGNAYAELPGDAAVTTEAFDVPDEAQFVTFRTLKSATATSCSHVYVLSGADFATETRIAQCKAAPAGWSDAEVSIAGWRGKRIKLRVRAGGALGVDDVARLKVAVPNWALDGDVTLVPGVDGNSLHTRSANVTTTAATVPAGAQNVVFLARSRYTGLPNPRVDVSVATGEGFTGETVLKWFNIPKDGLWRTYRAGIGGFAGKTVQLQFTTQWDVELAGAGSFESVAPGWSVEGGHPIAAGTDADGSYVEPAPLAGALEIRSGRIDPGLLDATGEQSREYSVTYDIGLTPNSYIRAYWVYPDDSRVDLWGASSNGVRTGRTTELIPVYDWLGGKGRLQVQLYGGRVYEVGSNVARQHLREPHSQKVGLLVDTSTGAFGYADTDIVAAGASGLGYTRYYSGHSDVNATLGWRWSDTYDTRLRPGRNGKVGVVFGSGAEEFFDYSANGTYTPTDPRVHSSMARNADGTYTYTTATNLAYRFTDGGVLTGVTDLNGRTTTLSYDASGRLSTVEAPGGARLTRGYDAGGRLVTVTDPDGAVTRYGYDTAGDLVTVTDPAGGVRRYAYERHLLTSATDRAGATLFTNTFDASMRVIRQTDAAGHQLTIAYADNGLTSVTDATGRTAHFYFDTQHRTTHTVDTGGYVTRNVYDAAGNLEKVIDPAGKATTFSHDAAGNTTAATDPLGNPVRFTYDTRHLPTTVVDARGNTSQLGYDARGNLSSSTDPLGRTTRFTYDASGNLLTETDPLERTTTHTYDAAGNRTSSTDPAGATWRWTYSAGGRKLAETDPLGRTTRFTYGPLGHLIIVTDPDSNLTTYFYDPAGRLIRVDDELERSTSWRYDVRGLVTDKTDPAGHVTRYGYDAERRLTSVTDPLGRVTAYGYDATGRVDAVTDPAGNTTRYAYDTAGRLASVADPLGRTTRYGYDDAGRLTGRTQPDGAVTGYAYDADGNLTAVTDPVGNATRYTYDAAGQLTEVTDPLGGATRHAYDAAGQRTRTTNPAGHTTETGYDAAGRTSSVTDPTGNLTRYTYDAAGQRTAVTDPAGKARAYTYTPTGRLASTVDPLGGATAYTYDAAGQTLTRTTAAGRVWRYAYDPRGLHTRTTDPAGHVTESSYDAAGQLTRATDPRGHAITYTYTGIGAVETMTDALGGVVRFGYDAAGQPTTVTDRRGNTRTTAYTALGQPATVTDPLGRVTAHEYDSLGRPTAVTDPRGLTTRTSYDAAGRVTAVVRPEGQTSFGYDAVGRTTSATGPTGENRYSYDAAGRVTSASSPAGTIGYTYDAAGRRATMTLPGPKVVRYGYDDAGHLATLNDPNDGASTFTYDPDGLPATTERPNGVRTTRAYTPDGRLATVEHRSPTALLARFTYTYDAAGNRTSATSLAGTETYQLDPLNRLTAVTYPDGATTGYSYDAAGNRLTETAAPGFTTAYTYDAAGQLAAAGPTTFDHDAAGNLTRAGDRTYTWDSQNRLTGLTTPQTQTSYTYDDEGNRVSATVDGSTTGLLYDGVGRLPELVQAGADTYLHADGPLATLPTGAPTSYPLGDALGSVRAVTDPAGTVTATIDYSAFGAMRSATGATGRFAYTGEPRDPSTGLTYLRARDLDPGLGRFLSADTVQPNAPGTQGYNLYAYVANNPTTWTDPTGHSVDVMLRPPPAPPTAPPVPPTAPAWGGRGALAKAIEALRVVRPNALLCRSNQRACAIGGFVIMAAIFACIAYPGCTRALAQHLNGATGGGDDGAPGDTPTGDGRRPAIPDPEHGTPPEPEPAAGGGGAKKPPRNCTGPNRLPGKEEARLQAMREAGIPVDAKPVDVLRNASGVQYVYDVNGTYMLVTENTMDRSHPGEPHWEAGRAKDPLRVDNYGRYRVVNQKVKVNFNPDC